MRRTSFDLLRRITRLEALNHGPDLEPMDADRAECSAAPRIEWPPGGRAHA